jgi:AGCS family alanine or glycine:cation symporter
LAFIEKSIDWANGILWGPPLLILIVGTGIYLTFRLGFLQFTNLAYALRLAFGRRHQDKQSKGDISHYEALTTALAATVGTGNIAGVATAVVLGGPGAVFWMWITAFFGMATKYAEAILAVKYRRESADGTMSGGPMHYIEQGLGWKWLAVAFAVFGSVAAFGIGNLVQINSVADAASSTFGVPAWVTGLVLAVLTGIVIIGGIKIIGRVTAFFVPIMALIYVVGGLVIIIMNLNLLPGAIGLIFKDAFTGSAVAGGAIGAVIRWGVARGVFSNEAGLGSSPIAAAAARTDYPARQALVSMTQVFIDTIIICSITGIVLVMAGQYTGGLTGASLTSASFEAFLGTAGSFIVSIGIILFAYSTVLGWSYYGEKCFAYLFGDKSVMAYRIVFVVMVFFGSILALELVWNFADMMNGLMAIPNLIALVALSGVVVAETKDFMAKVKPKTGRAAKESIGQSGAQ